MIASICSYCQNIIKTTPDGKPAVIYSHGICRQCLPDVQAEVSRQIAEMDAAEGRVMQ